MTTHSTAAHFIHHGTRPADLNPGIEWPTWADNLGPAAVAELQAHLEADEFCACGHRDDQHDQYGACEGNNDDPNSFDAPHSCYAYNPVQR